MLSIGTIHECSLVQAKSLAPIWESSYLNKEGLLFQEETLQVRRFI